MRFLVDANLPRRTVEVITASGHEAISVRDIGLGAAPDDVIATYAQSQHWCILTRDVGFGDIRTYPPKDFHGIVVVSLPNHASIDLIVETIRRFIDRLTALPDLAGRLAVVDIDRIRVRHAT